MPDYVYRCGACAAETIDSYPIGTARRVKKCDCGRPARLVIGEHVHISAEATPTSKGNVVALARRDRQFETDAPAYKRMRHRGLQPDHIDGSARLEDRVDTQDQIDYGRAIAVAKKVGKREEDVIEVVRSLTPTHGDV